MVKSLIKYIILLFVYIILNTENSKSQITNYISPGLKLGYQLGDNSGFTNGFIYGFEISYTKEINFKNNSSYGVVFNLDYCKGLTKIHIGGQISSVFGIEIGPTLLLKDKLVELGVTGNVFAGFIVMPYTEYSYFPSIDKTISQYGIFIKRPYIYEDGKLSNISFKMN
jgi:hypothetical protein